MSCEQTRKFLDAFVDGELEPGLLLEVEAHLEGCAGCAALVSLKQRLKRELAELGEVSAPAALRERVIDIAARRNTRRRRLYALAAVPLAAAAALLLIFVVGGEPGGGDAPLTAVVDDVVQRHVRELPLEVRGPDPAQATSWFRGKVDFPVRAPRLALENASFHGARLSNVREQQAAQMVYSIDGHRVTLMVFPAARLNVRGGDLVHVGGRDVVLGRRNGFNVAVLIDGDMAYALSSDLPRDRLVALLSDFAI